MLTKQHVLFQLTYLYHKDLCSGHLALLRTLKMSLMLSIGTVGDFTFWIISVLILEYKIIINLADEFRYYPVVRIDIRIIRKLN